MVARKVVGKGERVVEISATTQKVLRGPTDSGGRFMHVISLTNNLSSDIIYNNVIYYVMLCVK